MMEILKSITSRRLNNNSVIGITVNEARKGVSPAIAKVSYEGQTYYLVGLYEDVRKIKLMVESGCFKDIKRVIKTSHYECRVSKQLTTSKKHLKSIINDSVCLALGNLTV